jgi:flavodoxin
MSWKKIGYVALIVVLGVLMIWGILTWFSNAEGAKQIALFGETSSTRHALIVYDPDPFYQLDQQVCDAMAEELAVYDWRVKVVSVAALPEKEDTNVDLYVFCANTYNWQPDQAIVNYIQKHNELAQQAVVAVTLGSGSTKRAQRLLREELEAKEANVLAEDTFWLMRPNDESHPEETNVQIALDQAKQLIEQVLHRLDHSELANDTF